MPRIPGRSRIAVLSALTVLALLLVWAVRSHTHRGFRTEDRYTKQEYRIPMRDGATLFTQVYIPRDRTRAYPFLIQRTPYSVAPYGPGSYRPSLGPAEAFDRAGYIFVFQDVRGRFQSEGEFVEFRPPIVHPAASGTDESTDTYDTVEWLLHHIDNNNGKAGLWGVSYAGFYTSASILDTHPAIRAASPEAPVTNLYLGDDAYHNGAFMLSAMYSFYAGYFRPRAGGPELPPATPPPAFSYGTEDGYKYFLEHGPGTSGLRDLIHNPYFDATSLHDTYDGYWQSRDISAHLERIRCPILVTGGWFDAEDEAGTLRTFHAIDRGNPGLVNILAMGPWSHGGWLRPGGAHLGPLDFGSATIDFYNDRIAFPFFEHYLKDAPAPDLPKAWVFETGSNQWRRYAAWPPPNAQSRSLYLHDHGRLSFDPPNATEAAADRYISDPANPVPYIEHPPTQVDESYMYADQRFAAQRPDVLTYATDPLPEDITIAGPIAPQLVVSTSSTDSDFDLKLIDGYPGSGPMAGYQQLVRGEPMRAKFRNSFTRPEPMIPGKPTPLHFDMPDVNHTFRRGHRIIVQIASSWFPLTDLNPQTFTRIPLAQPASAVKAAESIYHQPSQASRIVLQIVPTH